MIEMTLRRPCEITWVCIVLLAVVWLSPLASFGGRSVAFAARTSDTAADARSPERPSAAPEAIRLVAAEQSASDDEHEHKEAGEHDHEHGAGETGGRLDHVIDYVGKFHPPMVNFPIAMLIGAALAEILFIATGQALFAHAARYCTWIGGVGAVLAGALGWCFGGFELTDSFWVMTTHRWLGTTTAAWAIVVLIVSEHTYRSARPSRAVYRGVLFAGAVLVSVTAFFGGALLYGIDHYAW